MSYCWESDPGYFTATPAATTEYACSAGTYQNASITTSCVPCSFGMYSPQPAATVCQTCGVGHYVATGSSSCELCDPGHFQNQSTGASLCPLCDPGSHAANQGQTNCDPCPAGYYSGSHGALTCAVCPEGTFSGVAGASTCGYCAENQVSGGLGATACFNCLAGAMPDEDNQFCKASPRGTFIATDGSAAPVFCQPGTFNPNPGAAACINCPAGTFAGDLGAVDCTDCPVGYFSTEGSSGCTACSPELATTNSILQQCTIPSSTPASNGDWYATWRFWVLMGCMVGAGFLLGLFLQYVVRSLFCGGWKPIATDD